ncbi:MAG: glgP [Ilumatobacteraceae bacterium]|nr:glgP [Ilumatobacteraceae bacterium]
MQSVRQFSVDPAVPEALSGLNRLANNLHWCWDRELQQLFAGLHPQAWADSGHQPLEMLGRITPTEWAGLAKDPSVVTAVADAVVRLDTALTSPRWFQTKTGPSDPSPLELVAYFSPEFGISESVPQYSGGLGILAGDHLKASSDLGIPLVGIGLLYAEGYFRQSLDADGFQQERFPRLEPTAMALTNTGLHVNLDLAGEIIDIGIWRADVGRISLYLLDAPGVTDRLYGGDVEHRLRQEMVLGIAGVRALRALGLAPQVFHTNEGHAGFLALERIRELVDTGLTFAEAVEASRAGGVFTTHTPVPAGIDRFPRELIAKYFSTYVGQVGISFDDLMAIGHRDDEPDETRFNMAVMGLRLAARANGVAKLHGAVSREMFNGLWPGVPVDEVPITSITNGVHAHSWISPEMDQLLRNGIHGVWDGADDASWARAAQLPAEAVWSARSAGRARLVEFVRDHMGDDILDPDILTIGFARRFATYKRATLLLSHPDRLRKMLLDPDRPVQFVFAGKAHPADQPGKEMIQNIERFARELDVRHRFVFLPDYDIAVARAMYHGCDVWLNNPRRPLEACGTSGMKAALNGALNCSIRDGWWDEWSDGGGNGWDIASADDDPDDNRRDQREALNLFGLFEQEIVPLFYDTSSAGSRADHVPEGWVDKMRHNWVTLGPKVTASRMVRDYVTELYEPAAAASTTVAADGDAPAKTLAAWKHTVQAAWPAVRIASLDTDTTPGKAGEIRSVTATVDLDGLQPTDVTVEVLHGPIDTHGELLAEPAKIALTYNGAGGTSGSWTGDYAVGRSGAYGLTARVLPQNPLLANPFEVGCIAWAQ